MCRVLAYLGSEVPLEDLLIKPENSLINQSLDPERHPQLQLAGWGFGAWGEHLLKPEKPFLYHRPMAAFYDDNVAGIVPSLQVSTMLAHVRAADYNAKTVLADENCHPFSFEGTPWIVAQNGDVPNWQLLQRELLQHCKDEYLEQMVGTTDTEFLYVLLLSVLESNSDEDVKRAFEEVIRLLVQAMEDLDLPALAKLKMALVSPNRIIGVNVGTGHQGEPDPEGDWRELRKSGPGTDDYALSMLLEPMYLLMGRNFDYDGPTYDFEETTADEATSVIFASEPLTESTEDWSTLEFGEIVFLERDGEKITKTVDKLKV
ncbi:class II glutamine amidotransferase [Aeromicrobium sp. 636]|uniref:Class II glutamine amidotransferase n=1 Tax=Aeromicrobium senzhongii TaxID=2663859 RepID=A0A8I0EUA4_9ACTN|nr:MULTISPECIES: class II glutamine amidotransferase [Aeromicrobium]MBC9225242.1 class II glutamine amidotransferase [Aeromicrobium senzhongii]MCQ3997352.1 class II glutamine amidotransferase [Aeromicrobium sp. 636]MTB87288.1 class II glutamine amidotransferase [Aeromicrobium senzhongii]QNL95646.1 class II glutamine amidotransferase [Aeromicrobium senzhongii]